MNKIALALLLLLVSCISKTPRSNAYKDIDPEFHQYVDRFIEASKGMVSNNDIKNLEMIFGEFNESSTIGICTLGLLRPKIIIDKKWWKNESSYLRKEGLVFHELAHCVLFRPHTSPSENEGVLGWGEKKLFKIGFYKKKPYLKDGCPASYMHPSLVNLECIYKHGQFYTNELFNATHNDCSDKEGVYCTK